MTEIVVPWWVLVFAVILFFGYRFLRSRLTSRSVRPPVSVRGELHNHLVQQAETPEDLGATAVPDAPPIQKLVKGIHDFRKLLREGHASGLDPVQAFVRARGLSPDTNDDEVLEACVNAGYAVRDFTAILAHRDYSLEEMAEEVNQRYSIDSIDAAEFVEALLPYAPGESAKERSHAVIQAIKSEWEEFDPAEAAKQFTGAGCSPADVFSICYAESDAEFGKLLMTLREAVPLPVEIVAEIADELDIDLDDEDVYRGLREENVPYEDIVKVMRLRGKTLTAIIDCEVAYSGNAICDDARDLKEWFAPSEIIEAVIDAYDPPPYDELVDLAADLGMSYAEIGALLKKKEINPMDVEEKLRDLELENRICLLYHMLPNLPATETQKEGE